MNNKKRFKHQFCFSLLVLFGVMEASLSFCEINEFHLKMPRNAQKSVGIIRHKGMGIGTGFLYGTSHWIYVVTAKHVLVDSTTDRLIYPEVRFLWRNLREEEVVWRASDITLRKDLRDRSIFLSKRDLIALRIGRIRETGWESEKNSRMVNLGGKRNNSGAQDMFPINSRVIQFIDSVEETMDVLVVGYPHDLVKATTAFQFDPDQPVFRRGMIAQINKKNNTIVIDGMIHGGNSGGPVFLTRQVSPISKEFFLIGVVSQKTADFIITNSTMPATSFQNAGYAVVEPTDAVIELLESAEQ